MKTLKLRLKLRFFKDLNKLLHIIVRVIKAALYLIKLLFMQVDMLDKAAFHASGHA
jgi:hypothetical protein